MNKSRVIFFDDEPQTSKRLKEALIKKGYEVVCPKTLQEALFEINTQEAQMYVHCAHSTQTYWKICEAIYKEYPYFPGLHIAVSPSAEAFHQKFVGSFHQKIRPLAPEKLFLRKVKQLVFVGGLQNQNERLKKKIKIHEMMEPLMESNNLFDLKQKMTLLFMNLFNAKNVLFFDSGEIDFFLSRKKEKEVIDLNQIAPNEHRVIAAKHITVTEIQTFLKKVMHTLPLGWQQRRKNHFAMTQKNEHFFVVPIAGPQDKSIIGHVMITEPKNFGDAAANQLIPYLQKVIGRQAEQIHTVQHAKGLSYIDDLTDLYNQRYLKLVLDKEINRAQRSESCFSVLFMDIDHFKRVNDTQGHIVGSKVLVELSKIVHENIRTMDFGFRYGGDEFLMILIGTNSQQAKVVAERMRKQVENSVFDIDGVQIKVTLSIGIASYPEHAKTKEQILELADEAMYVGKKKSRNIVYVAS